MTAVLARCYGPLPDQPCHPLHDPPLAILALAVAAALVVAVAVALTRKDPA